MSTPDHVRGVPGSRTRLDAQVWEGAKVDEDPALIPELSEVGISDELREKIEWYMGRYPERHSAVIPALTAAQQVHGWCSPEAINQVAAVMRVTPAYLESIASFYDMLDLEPVGEHRVYMCTNISCTLRGAPEVLEALAEATGAPVGASSTDGLFFLREFECLGACDIAPMASIDGNYRGPLTADDAREIVEGLRAGKPIAEILPDKTTPEAKGGR